MSYPALCMSSRQEMNIRSIELLVAWLVGWLIDWLVDVLPTVVSAVMLR